MSVSGIESLTKFIDPQKVQEVLGRITDILNKNSSDAVLVGITFIWFLFEVMGILLAPVLCYILILFMFIMFAWSKAAGAIKLSPPSSGDIKLPESVVEQINSCLQTFYEISRGEDLKLFFMTIASLYAISFLGNYLSFLTLTYIGENL